MQYDDSYGGEARITFTSIFLLVIFVSAFALILAAAIWRPWFNDDASPVVQQPAAEATADVSGVPVTNEGVAPDAAAEQVGVPVGQ